MKTILLIAIIVFIFKNRGGKFPTDDSIKESIKGRTGILSVLGVILAFLILC